MKCPLCTRRKGKRYCPAKQTSICAQCCGEKRVVEIDCPADCPYLTEGQYYQSVKKMVSQLQNEEDPLRRRKLLENSRRFDWLLTGLEEEVVRYAGGLRSLSDDQVLQAVSLLRRTYRTEQKGIIYEHSSSDPLVQSLAQELRRLLETARTNPQPQFPALSSSDVLDCLDVLEENIRYHLDSGERGRYLDFIRRNHPEAASASRPGLIVPV